MRRTAAMATLACAMMLAATHSFAQLKYFEDGQSGFTAGTGINGGEDFEGFDIGFVYTAGGRLDLGLAFKHVSLDEPVLGADANSMAIAPSLTFGLVRATPEFAVGVEFSVAIQSDFDFDYRPLAWPGEEKQEVSTQSLVGLLAVNTREEYSPLLTIYPEMFVGYLDADTKLNGVSSYLVESDVSELVFGGSLSSLFKRRLLFSASYRWIDNEDTWGLTVGYLTSPSQ